MVVQVTERMNNNQPIYTLDYVRTTTHFDGEKTAQHHLVIFRIFQKHLTYLDSVVYLSIVNFSTRN